MVQKQTHSRHYLTQLLLQYFIAAHEKVFFQLNRVAMNQREREREHERDAEIVLDRSNRCNFFENREYECIC